VGATEEYRVGLSRRFRAVQRRQTRAAARVAMLVVVGVSVVDLVTSAGQGPIVVAIDVVLIGLAVAGWWSLAHWTRHYPEWVTGIVATGMVVTMAATVVAVPDLTVRTAGYFLILPLVLALLLPWPTRSHLAWLVAYLTVALGYLALFRNDALTPDLRGDVVTVLVIASGASLVGRALLEKAQIRSFIQLQHIRALRRQGDANVTQLTHAHIALHTLEATAEDLEQRVLHDPLTGLANRVLLGDRLAHGLTQRGTTIAFVMLDIDEFKAINDRLGHAPGDAVLLRAAERFASVLRAGDTLARLGGDEFAVVAPGVKDAAAACALADRLLGSLGAPVRLRLARGGVDVVTVQASAGIAVAEAGECDAREIMRRADVALYSAKERGKNRWDLFEASMDTDPTAPPTPAQGPGG
jgi:diguanylate cyclase (GGDEF)-like protein